MCDEKPIIVHNDQLKNTLEGLRSKEFQEWYFKTLEETADWECEICPTQFPQEEKDEKFNILGFQFCEECWNTYQTALKRLLDEWIIGINKIRAHYKEEARRP